MSLVDQLKAAESMRLTGVEVTLHSVLEGVMIVRLTFDDDLTLELTIADR